MKQQETTPHTAVTNAAWKTIEQWMDCVKRRDIDTIITLYSQTDCAFWGTFGDHLRQTQAEIKTYFNEFLNCESISCQIIDCASRELSSEIAAFSGSYAFKIVKNPGDSEIEAIGRFTYTVRKLDGTWTLVEHHSSLMPENGY